MIGWLHGFAGAPAQWDAMDLPGVRPWLPGHGPDGAPGTATTFEEAASTLLAPLRGVRVLVGYSMGARLALALALRGLPGLTAVVLVGGTPGIEDPAERAARIADDERLAHDLLDGGVDAFMDRWEALPLFATQSTLPREVRAAQRRWRTVHRPAGLAWALATLGTGAMPSYWEALSCVTVPVHAVTGDLDAKFTAVAEAMVRRSGGRVTHHRVPGCGHNVVLERPAAVRDLLRSLTGR